MGLTASELKSDKIVIVGVSTNFIILGLKDSLGNIGLFLEARNHQIVKTVLVDLFRALVNS